VPGVAPCSGTVNSQEDQECPECQGTSSIGGPSGAVGDIWTVTGAFGCNMLSHVARVVRVDRVDHYSTICTVHTIRTFRFMRLFLELSICSCRLSGRLILVGSSLIYAPPFDRLTTPISLESGVVVVSLNFGYLVKGRDSSGMLFP
jgi:hypothetical protein